jgi:hypothetical protein
MKLKNYKTLMESKKYLMSVLFVALVSYAGAATQYIRWGTSKDLHNGLNVTWNGSGTADSIQWGYTNSFEKGKFLATSRAASPLAGKIFFYDFGNNITPAATIYYKIKDSGAGTWGAEKTKATVPAATVDGVNFTFCATGDSRDDYNMWNKIATKMAAHKPACVVFNGDLTLNGTGITEWTNWLTNATPITEIAPIFHAQGNHESSLATYINQFNLPKNGNNTDFSYFSVTYGNVIFISLNAEISMAPQNTWLDAQLKAAQTAGVKWAVVSWHEPYYTYGSHGGEMTDWSWWATFDKYGVDLVLNGHDHCYERIKPVNRTVSTTAPVAKYGSGTGEGRCQIVCGGAGAPLYSQGPPPSGAPGVVFLNNYQMVNNYIKCEVTGCVNNTTSITVTAIDANGATIDNFTLSKTCTVTNTGVGISESRGQIFNPISVSPNPVTGKFTLKYSSDVQGEAFVKVYTMEGKEVRSTVVNKSAHDLEYNGDLSGLAKGVYNVTVIMGSQRDNAVIVLK